MARSEYLSMERSELAERLGEARRELFNLRFQKATGQLDNTARVGHVRKEVARILTILREQQLGGSGTIAGTTEGAYQAPGAGTADDDEEA